ncbi:phosphoglycolate phosphatase [Kordiimonas sediminis]|uniref:Phosphoglycolate phosphatase n=1 Tax=Kordiimonas sediminis TaxID=1735581 RepID=A0A919E5C6_9PROT|nr:HAD hydrolase-like protein [Kordiimonas sediminis]GHF15523.1 phosphoglycolate phosphatase [Kordiimonas sediminis]
MHLTIFDIDGTLINSSAFEDRLYSQAVKDCLQLDCPTNWEGYTHVTDAGILAELIFKQLNREMTDKELAMVRDRFIELMMDELDSNPDVCQPIAGAHELLEKLHNSDNHMVAIATGGWGTTACFKLATAGFSIDRLIIASSDDHFDRMEIMTLARERAEERVGEKGFETITYVGDAPWDELASEGLGWRFIGIGEMLPHADIKIEDYLEKDDLFFL